MPQKLLSGIKEIVSFMALLFCWGICASVYCCVFFFMYIPMRERSGSIKTLSNRLTFNCVCNYVILAEQKFGNCIPGVSPSVPCFRLLP